MATTTKAERRGSGRNTTGSRGSTGSARGRGSADSITANNVSADDRRFLEKNQSGLSKTTLRAKWIHSPDEHEDRAGQTLATRTPDVIKAWAAQRGGEPATTQSSRAANDGRPHVLRINFPDRGGRSLVPVSWDDWFRSFQERDLVFLFQEHRRNGGDSNFFRLDNPKREDG